MSAAVLAAGAAYVWLAVASVVLVVTDIRSYRLPNRVVLPGYVVLPVLFAAACVAGAPWPALGRAAVGGAALFAFYLVLRSVGPRGVGGGDVKLAGVLGIALGWAGWGALVVGAAAAFLLAGLYASALVVSRRADRSTRLAFGPWMIAGAWLGLVLGPLAAGLYPSVAG